MICEVPHLWITPFDDGKRSKAGRKKEFYIDVYTVALLQQEGWNLKQIAASFHCSMQTISNVMSRGNK
jgi:lambda repressor-like predicted transcriptional regulator